LLELRMSAELESSGEHSRRAGGRLPCEWFRREVAVSFRIVAWFPRQTARR
jgi:hypothetical protein